jgi:hypothetical protein
MSAVSADSGGTEPPAVDDLAEKPARPRALPAGPTRPIRAVLDAAVRDGALAANPAASIRRPRTRPRKQLT